MNLEPIRQITVLGAGSWGTALAILLDRNGFQVRLWGHEDWHIANLQRERENKLFLPGISLATAITPMADLKTALSGTDEILVVVPSHAFHNVLKAVASLLPITANTEISVSWATKGFAPQDNRLLHEVAREVLGPASNLAVISGPTFAREVALGLPTAVTVAATQKDYARRVANYLHSPRFRAYISDDIIGVEVGGATKNVLAIAAGIADGLGFGANTRAALITRGLTELTRFGIALGGNAQTFMGLAGLGDLALTCTDDQSRNRRLGLLLAKGLNIEQACHEIGQEVEGIATARAIFRKAQVLGVEMPICEQTYRVLHERVAPATAAQILLERAIRDE